MWAPPMWLERFLREWLGMGGGQALEEEILNLGSWWGGVVQRTGRCLYRDKLVGAGQKGLTVSPSRPM